MIFANLLLFFSCAAFAEPQAESTQTAKTVEHGRLLNYTGFITDSLGHPLEGTQRLRFTIAKSTGAKESVWSDTMDVSVASGVFNVRLGEGAPLPKEAFELDYRIEVATAPVAAKAVAPAPAEETPTPTARVLPSIRYWVQVGSFADDARARALADALRSSGHSASTTSGKARGVLYHMVRVGPFEARPDAQAEADKLAALGHPAVLIKR